MTFHSNHLCLVIYDYLMHIMGENTTLFVSLVPVGKHKNHPKCRMQPLDINLFQDFEIS